jgi:hypothetical protein
VWENPHGGADIDCLAGRMTQGLPVRATRITVCGSSRQVLHRLGCYAAHIRRRVRGDNEVFFVVQTPAQGE